MQNTPGNIISSVVVVINRKYASRGDIIYLEMRRRYTSGQLLKKWFHHFLKFGRLDHIQNFFQFIQEHHLDIQIKRKSSIIIRNDQNLEDSRSLT